MIDESFGKKPFKKNCETKTESSGKKSGHLFQKSHHAM